MKVIILPSMADAFRRADGTLPDNVEVWDGRTRAVGGPETWLGDCVSLVVDRLPSIKAPYAHQPAAGPAQATFKGKRVAQWKQERRGIR